MHILSGANHPPLSFSSWSTAFWVETEGCSCNRMFLAALDVAVPSLIFSVIGATPSLLRRSSLNHRMVKAGQSERPPEHLYRHGMQGLFMLLGRWQAFCPIYGEWVQYSLVDVCLKIFWYFQSPLQPHSIDSYRMVSLSNMTRDHRYLNCNHCPGVAFDFGAFASASSSAYDNPLCGRFPCMGITEYRSAVTMSIQRMNPW